MNTPSMMPHEASSTALPQNAASYSRTHPAALPRTSGPAHTDRALLAPEDAISLEPPPRESATADKLRVDVHMNNGSAAGGGRSQSRRGRRGRTKERNGSKRRKFAWKKLLWVKQSYPDNYTDQETFLEHLQRNPRLQPYEFWPLVADSTVIVQQVCAVIIFIACFVGIFQERVSPVTVVGTGTLSTVLGWLAWDRWVWQDEDCALRADQPPSTASSPASPKMNARSADPRAADARSQGPGLGLRLAALQQSSDPPTNAATPIATGAIATYNSRSSLSPRNQQRLATLKSAVLIYSALLGLSPILKSLTRSTSSDSIWALSTWLLIINVFLFDYGGNVGVKFQASLSTNAALMASTVLASRLPSTQHVFSLTLFSIEVFGLFPVFRRHLRHVSWRWHVVLTALLVMIAGAGVGMVISGGGWKAAMAGMTLGNIIAGLAMGGCSWWLIGLQKYKNEIHGPWDPARPILRRRWEDDY